MAISKQKALQLTARRDRVSTAYLSGVPQYRIAEQEKVDPGQITRDIAALEKEWVASGVRNIDAVKAAELARIDNLERTAWEGYERSRRTRTRTIRKTIHNGKEEAPKEVKTEGTPPTQASPVREENSTQKEGRDGDPRFLERVAWCIEQRCKLFGLLKEREQGGDNFTVELSAEERVVLTRRVFARLGLAEDVNGQA